jgi:hypothetical protein
MVTTCIFAKTGHDLKQVPTRPLPLTAQEKHEKLQAGDRTWYFPKKSIERDRLSPIFRSEHIPLRD